MDTIAAISTAPGRAAVAVVRVSGPEVPAIIERVLGSSLPEREPVLRWLLDPEDGARVDQVLATHFPAPRSYTGEQMLELGCHGGSLAPQLALTAVLAAGARQAERGEFTRRAYVNGKLDLLQAEAILDIVDGRSSTGHRAALHQLDRGLSRRIEELREALVRCEALLVYEIDFPEEDEGPVSPEAVADAAREVLGRIDRLLETAAEGELVREGALVVIAGRPNAGKSSLFNALCGVERAIVTEEPGTTRDAVEAVVSLDGFPFRLVDTAGLGEARGEVERIGIEVARRYLANADVVLFCAEAGRRLSEEELAFIDGVEAEPTFLVRTKSDLVDEATAPVSAPASTPAGWSDREAIVSAREGVGLGELRDRLVSAIFAGLAATGAETPLVTRERHARELRRARSDVAEFLEARKRRVAPEVAATHLRAAAVALEEMLGVIAPDDLLARVFSEFCIGK